mgnify:FL=1
MSIPRCNLQPDTFVPPHLPHITGIPASPASLSLESMFAFLTATGFTISPQSNFSSLTTPVSECGFCLEDSLAISILESNFFLFGFPSSVIIVLPLVVK